MPRLPDETLEQLADLVHRRLGLHFARERWTDLTRGVEATCLTLGEPGIEDCARKLLSRNLDRNHIEVLGRHLTIGETYFFREPQAFRYLREEYLPPLLEQRGSANRMLRMWSAACASGEEPYSLAILLQENLPDLAQWNVTLLATDLNTDSLHRAKEGVYGNWSFRTTGEPFKRKWFTQEKDRFRLHPDIRRMVTLAFLNLVDDPYPSLTNNTNAMDVIFCRNVLMYFAPQTRARVLENLQRCLVPGGLLILGAAEGTLDPVSGLHRLEVPDLVAFRKGPPTVSPRKRQSRAVTAPSPPASQAVPPPRPARPPSPASKPPHLSRTLKDAFDRGDFHEVCRRAPELQREDEDYSDGALLAARACANQGDLPAALSWVDQVLRSRRTLPEGHYLRAMILDELGRTREALDALRTTIYLDHEFIPAEVALGNIYRREGARGDADRHFRNALVLLEPFGDDHPIPHAEDMRAGRLREAIIAAMQQTGTSEERLNG